ncbi:TonB protein C-terminal [Flavobacterium fontis]|uniref:TonB protein C-terminal n=2 Tax=Flavobacterium fontis TaxID=1124188 RepID=A0A1M5B6C5_9FLAO|nr:TonB protein C-terminal [Flavobacterium fontis]
MLCVMYLLTLVAVAQPIQPPKMPVFPLDKYASFEDFLAKQSAIAIDSTQVIHFKVTFYIDNQGTVCFPTVFFHANEADANRLFNTLLQSPKWRMEGVQSEYMTLVEKSIRITKGQWEAKTKFMSYKSSSLNLDALKSQSVVAYMPQGEESKPVLVEEEPEPVYASHQTEIKPEFPGGQKAFYSFIGKAFKAPDVPGFNGTVFVSFVIEKDGTLAEIKVLRDAGYGTGEEAVRVLKSSPKWQPATQRGVPVRCRYSIPIKIKNN